MTVLQKGYLENMNTGVIQRFQYNPEQFSDSQTVTYAIIKTPGISYPRYQYIGGEAREVSFDIFVDGVEYTNGVLNWVNFLSQMLPAPNSGSQFTQPPTLLFAFGTFVKPCLLTSLKTQYTQFDSNLTPTRATFSVTLEVIQ